MKMQSNQFFLTYPPRNGSLNQPQWEYLQKTTIQNPEHTEEFVSPACHGHTVTPWKKFFTAHNFETSMNEFVKQIIMNNIYIYIHVIR